MKGVDKMGNIEVQSLFRTGILHTQRHFLRLNAWAGIGLVCALWWYLGRKGFHHPLVSVFALALVSVLVLVLLLGRRDNLKLASYLGVLGPLVTFLGLFWIIGKETDIHFIFILLSVNTLIYPIRNLKVALGLFFLHIIIFACVAFLDLPTLWRLSGEEILIIQRVNYLFFSISFLYSSLLVYNILSRLLERLLIGNRIFENQAVGMLEIDLSRLALRLRALKKIGTRDIGEYLEAHPELLNKVLEDIRIREANAYYLDMMKADSLEALQEARSRFYSQEYLPMFQKLLKVVFEEKPVLEAEIILENLQGEPLVLWVTANFFKRDSFQHVLFNFVNITEQRRVEEALVISEARYRSLFENNLTGVAVTDASGKFMELNPAFCQIGGFEPKDLAGKGLLDITWEGDIERCRDYMEELKQGTIHSFSLDKRFVRKDKGFVDVHMAVKRMDDEEGNYTGCIISIKDISAQKKQEEIIHRSIQELNKKNAELERYIESNMQLENFAYIASHDLREPLLTTLGYAAQLKKKYYSQLDAKGKVIVHQILKGAQNMDELIKSLLIYSRVHNQPLEAQRIDLPSLIQSVINDLAHVVEEKQAQITVGDLPKTIWGNPVMIKQLWVNLIGNAMKFHKSGKAPEVSLSADDEGGHWTFSISDKGIGIDPKHHEKIFLLFQRLYNRSEYQGYGMGLAICRKIIEKHGGSIRVESALDQGTTFIFSLPKEGQPFREGVNLLSKSYAP